MTLSQIHLTLARDSGHPGGDRHCGYQIVAPLDAEGYLDPIGWAEHADACTVVRFWEGEATELGRLVHRQDGWLFDYDPEDDADDEPGYRFESRIFRPGEYVAVKEHDGVTRTFRVDRVLPIDARSAA